MEPKTKRVITEKQKAARTANLANARKKKAELLKQKASSKKVESDFESLSDSSSDSSSDESSDSEAYTISKSKSKSKKAVPVKKPKKIKIPVNNEVQDLKSLVLELATMNKQQHKKINRESKKQKSGGNVNLILPQNNPVSAQPSAIPGMNHGNRPMDPYLESLRKNIFGH